MKFDEHYFWANLDDRLKIWFGSFCGPCMIYNGWDDKLWQIFKFIQSEIVESFKQTWHDWVQLQSNEWTMTKDSTTNGNFVHILTFS
jgi:hypothetical protein